MTDGVSNEPVISATPTPISVEPRSAPAEVAEVARQAEEAKVAANEAVKKSDAPKGDKDEEKAKPLSIRESLAKAREKLDAAPTTPAKPLSVATKDAPVAEAAVVKDASNAAKEAPAAKTADVPPAAKDNAPARAEDGKFVSTKPAAETPAVAVKDAPTADAKPALPSHTASPAPARFSAAAKEKWAEAPEEVRAETERAVSELTKGFEKHRAAAERDSSIAEFHEMATKGGTTVKEALGKYVGMENQLRADPIKGLELIAKNVGLNLRDVAAKILNQPVDQVRSESDATIRALEAKLANLEKGLGTLHTEREQAKTSTTTEFVQKFAADPANSRFEELADDIANFMTPVHDAQGNLVRAARTKDLAEAYKLAERLNPAPATPVPAAVASSAPAPARTTPTLVPAASSSDAGNKSIAGTPSSGSDPVRKQPSNSIKEAIRRAQAAAG